MKPRSKWHYATGAVLAAVVVAVIAVAFTLLNRPETQELCLIDGIDERFGWRYELLSGGETRTYEPTFGDGVYVPELPEGTEAVRISRTMTEEVANAELEWHSYLDGVEVFLNGELLHTDFRGNPSRGADGFLRLTDADWERLHRAQGEVWQRTRTSLPSDYLGKELQVVTYFPADWGIAVAEYPYLGSEDSYIASYVLESVKYDVMMTVYALLALLIAAVILMDISNDGADWKTALLCVYFLLLFVREAAASYVGYYSQLGARVDMSLIHVLYVAPLYFYLALRLKKKWSRPLCAVIAVWAISEAVRYCLRVRAGLAGTAGSVGPWALAVFLAVAIATCADIAALARRSQWYRKRAALYGLLGALIAAAYIFNKCRIWGSARGYLVEGIWGTLQLGNFEPLVSTVTDIASIIALIAVVSEFARRTLRTRQEMSVLQERARQTMEGYNRLLAAESATSALHHEMRHHMTAISGILKGGDVERAARYADAVAGDLDRLPAGRYSQNLLVDVIAGSYLDRARTRGIRVEHRLGVPPELDIADEDLSVFLSNLLQNALEACEKMGEGAERFIRVEMRLRGKFLFIRCANSAPEEAEAERRPGHGYGLTAMRKIAEKYDSALVIERTEGEFAVKSDLCLHARPEPDTAPAVESPQNN